MSKTEHKKLTKEQELQNKENLKITNELIEYSKNPNVGINFEIPEAFANGHTFKINPHGHEKKYKDQIRAIQKTFDEKIMSVPKMDLLKANDINEEASKQILEIALVNFNYDEWANHVDVGPTVLEQMTNEVATFLVVQGGKAGFKHWQMQQKLAMQTLSNR